MSEAPRERQPGAQQPRHQGHEQPSGRAASERALGALEQALRDALGAANRERVLRTLGETFAQFPVEIDAGPDTRFHSRVQKVSVSMPEALTLAIRERTGPGGFSRFVAEAAEKRLRGELLDEYLDGLDTLHGSVPPDLTEQAKREWPDYEAE